MGQLDLLGEIETAELASGSIVVTASGPLDGRVAGTLRDALAPLAADERAFGILDLSAAHGLDDETIEVIAQAAHEIRLHGGHLVIVSAARTVTDQIRACGLDEIVRLQASLDDTNA